MGQRDWLVHHVHIAGQHIVERVSAAAIGHVQDIDTGLELQGFEPEVNGRAGAGRGK